MARKRVSRRQMLKMVGLGAAGAALAACQPQTVIVEKEVEKVVEKVVTQIVEVEKEVIKIVAGTPVVEKVVETKVVEKVVKETVIVPAQRDITVTFLSQQPTIAEKDPLDALMANYEAENPGVKVARLTTAAGGDYFTKLVTMTAANNPPDIFYMPPWNLIYFVNENLLAALDPYVASAGFDIDDVPEALVNAYSWGGALFGFPVLGSTVRLYAYNKDAFDEAGVEYPTRYWKYDEFLDKVQKVKKTSGDQVEMWGVDPLIGNGAYGLNWLWSFGADFYDYPAMTKCTMDQPEAIQAMQASADLIRTHEVWAPPEIGPEDLGISFQTGRVAIGAVGTGEWIDPAQSGEFAWPFNWALIDTPATAQTSALIHSAGMSIAARSSNRDTAWELMAFLMSEESQTFYSEAAGKIAGLKSVGAKYAFQNIPQADQDIITEAMGYAWGRAHWRTPVWSKSWENAADLFRAMWLGELTVEEACLQAAAETNQMLEEAASQ